MKRIYLDYASLTPTDKRVLKTVKKFSKGEYANPSSLYASGVKALKALNDAKERVSALIHAHPDEIIFTSGGTEANQLVLNMVPVGKKIIISDIEHSSIRLTDKNVTVVSVDLEALKKAITPDTALVSVMLVNNEIGSIQPIRDIAKIVRDVRKANGTQFPLLHTDACQAPIHMELFVEKLGVDLMTLDSNKVYGPRSVGMLYVRRGTVEIKRAGTENIPGIQGFAQALEIADAIREKETTRITELKKFFLEGLQKIRPDISVNGNLQNSTPHILNVSIPGIDNEFFVLQLDAKGVECSTKSACLRDEDESYVLKAIGANSRESIRFSFGRDTSMGDIKKALTVMSLLLK